MEDYEAHDEEFWRKLEEESMSRSSMLRRSAAAAAGLTILTGPSAALAAVKAESERLTSEGIPMKQLIKAAKKEGHLNIIACPRDWANYGAIMDTFQKKYGLGLTDANPEGTSAQENQAIVSLKGDNRAPDAVDVGPSFAVQGAAQGLYAQYKVKNWKTIPASLKDARGRFYGDYWGAISIGYNANLVHPAPKTFKDLLKPAYKNQVALNGSPLTSNSAVSGVFAASLANGGSVNNIEPGIQFFRDLKNAGNFIPVQGSPQTVASGQTPIVMDWDYLNIGYKKEFPAANWHTVIDPKGVYASQYVQAINLTAPHPNAGRLWEEFLYSDQGQLLWLAGFSHPVRFADLAKRKVIPKKLLAALPPAKYYKNVHFANDAQQSAAKAKIAAEWPTI
ncbi:MAG TPA: ABC transporter substrate-binding protein [Gaiellaceae bacterium]|jgi:putative spermidine/putrescine transport system substrate-binding protein|nr:ABC transporter substrate-binding protein [Gaiellaceae bacterium]